MNNKISSIIKNRRIVCTNTEYLDSFAKDGVTHYRSRHYISYSYTRWKTLGLRIMLNCMRPNKLNSVILKHRVYPNIISKGDNKHFRLRTYFNFGREMPNKGIRLFIN